LRKLKKNINYKTILKYYGLSYDPEIIEYTILSYNLKYHKYRSVYIYRIDFILNIKKRIIYHKLTLLKDFKETKIGFLPKHIKKVISGYTNQKYINGITFRTKSGHKIQKCKEHYISLSDLENI